MATVEDGGALQNTPHTLAPPPEVKKHPHLIMADWASLPPNLSTPLPMGPLTLMKGSPTGRRGLEPRVP